MDFLCLLDGQDVDSPESWVWMPLQDFATMVDALSSPTPWADFPFASLHVGGVRV